MFSNNNNEDQCSKRYTKNRIYLILVKHFVISCDVKFKEI